MSRGTLVFLLGTLAITALPGDTPPTAKPAAAEESKPTPTRADRSPVDLVLTKDQKWLVTVNQTSHSISLIDVAAGRTVHELTCDTHPSKVALSGDGQHLVVTSSHRGTVAKVAIKDKRLSLVKSVAVGHQPIGVAALPGTQRVFVGLVATGEVAEVDLKKGVVLRQFPVGKWPRYLAVSPNGKRLAIGLSGESKIAVHDVASGKQLYYEPLIGGINLGHMQCSNDGKYVYFPWMVYRSNPITQFNIRKGWVLASRIGRVRLDGSSYREAISLDVPGKAVADPHGLAFSPNEKRLVVAASGTHELLVYRNADLPYVASGGPGDLIDRKLLRERDLFYRIELGGRPMGVTIADDNRTAFVANHLRNSVQVVDIEAREVKSEITLGPRPSQKSLARRGMEIFYDGRRSLEQ